MPRLPPYHASEDNEQASSKQGDPELKEILDIVSVKDQYPLWTIKYLSEFPLSDFSIHLNKARAHFLRRELYSTIRENLRDTI